MRRKKVEEAENHERWLVSYADFITLLFAFFVIMYATSNNNPEKQKKFEESVRVNLKIEGSQGGKGSQNGQNISEIVPELANPIEGFTKAQDPKELEDYVGKEIGKKISADVKNHSIAGIKHDVMGLRITLAASAFFPTGSSKLKRESLPVLDEVAEILKQTNRKIIIEGHTDNQFYLGPNGETNWELASNRATSVIRYLVKIHKLDSKRMAAISYADQKPLVENNDDEGRAKNRRIEILLANEQAAD